MLLLTHFTDAVAKQQLLAHFTAVAGALGSDCETRHCEQREIVDAIRSYVAGSEDSIDPGSLERSVIFTSDLLADERRPTALTRTLAREFSQMQVAMLAVTRHGRKALEVDRSIRADFSADDLREAVELLLERLKYMQPALKGPEPAQLSIREIYTEAELYKYFSLRHRIYRIMGYLSDEIERDCSLEVDDCDRSAIHMAAFTREQARDRENMVGTVRLLLPHRRRFECERAVSGLVESTPALKDAVERSKLNLELPVFQSNRELAAHYDDHLNGVPYGELSRLIVDNTMRGRGIAPKLMAALLERAEDEGVKRLLLECLEAHVAFYARFGFTRLEGVSGRVIGIGRTMVSMILDMGKREN